MKVGPPVAFDFGGVLALCRDLWSLADDLESYFTKRGQSLATALQDWKGPEAETMMQQVYPAEAANLATGINQLRSGAVEWAVSWADAQRQYNNREYALAVNAEKDSRSFGESFVDGLLGQDDSGRQVPAPGDSSVPQPPSFLAASGFAVYTENGHSDWSLTYRYGDGPSGGGASSGSW